MSKQYNFLDCNFFTKEDKTKDIYNNFQKSNDIMDIVNKTEEGILDPEVSIVEIKDVKKGS